MPTTSRYALRILFQDVKDRFLAEGPSATVVFGQREPAKQINQGPGGGNRVAFVPGDRGGKAGKYEGAKLPRAHFGTTKARSLLTMREICTVYVWGVDASDLNDEAKQYEAARELHDFVVRAIYRSQVGHGSYTLSNPTWAQKNTERKNGAELYFTIEFEARIPDESPLAPDITTTKPTTGIGPTAILVDTTAVPPVEENDGSDTTPPP